MVDRAIQYNTTTLVLQMGTEAQINEHVAGARVNELVSPADTRGDRAPGCGHDWTMQAFPVLTKQHSIDG